MMPGSFSCFVKAAEKMSIIELLTQLETLNPTKAPTEDLEIVAGEWRLLFSTISILGSRRTKLGLRSFVSLGDFIQKINVEESAAVGLSNLCSFTYTAYFLCCVGV